jgi:hypothetical protein
MIDDEPRVFENNPFKYCGVTFVKAMLEMFELAEQQVRNNGKECPLAKEFILAAPTCFKDRKKLKCTFETSVCNDMV